MLYPAELRARDSEAVDGRHRLTEADLKALASLGKPDLSPSFAFSQKPDQAIAGEPSALLAAQQERLQDIRTVIG
jgi:hypothetical protein